MEYFLIFAALVVFLMIKSSMENRKKDRLLRERLRESFGQVPEQEYSQEKFDSIRFYFRSKGMTDPGVIDDITWNDLDMDEIYLLLNQTCSAMGEEYLYDLLRRPTSDASTLAERQRVIDFFFQNEKERVTLQHAFARIGKLRSLSLFEYYNRAVDLASRSAVPDILQGILLAASIVLACFQPDIGAVAILVMLCLNVVTYFRRKKQVEPYLQVIAFLVRLTGEAEKFRSFNIPELASYLDRIRDSAKAFAGFRRHAWLINSGSSMSGNLADIIMDYVRILFHVDLIKFSGMIGIIRERQEELDRIYETIGFLDSCMAAASFRAWLPKWCVPALTEGQIEIQAENLYHPLLDDPVKNSIRTQGSVLITGSNASGKSTFLKTLAVNAILSQTIYTAVCDSYRAGYFRIYSSMALKDDLFGGESYYMVEIKSLKRILDAAQETGEAPVLCFIDEVLRGTNTLERIAASSQILSELAERQVMAFVATHDLELTQILEEQYTNYHFSEEVLDDDIHFDYKLKSGRAQSRNAIRLLELLGFPQEITAAAERRAEDFLKTQEWSKIR